MKKDGTAGSEGDLAGFGTVQNISVGERGAGGGIRRLDILYENGSVNLFTEYNVRYVLGAISTKVTDKDNNPVDMKLLPSAHKSI